MSQEKLNGSVERPAAPDPELVEKASRRRFSAEYKPRIVREADACNQRGEIGALLRREGLYTSHLTQWRQARDAGALEALERPRGRKRADPRRPRTPSCAAAWSAPNASLRRPGR